MSAAATNLLLKARDAYASNKYYHRHKNMNRYHPAYRPGRVGTCPTNLLATLSSIHNNDYGVRRETLSRFAVAAGLIDVASKDDHSLIYERIWNWNDNKATQDDVIAALDKAANVNFKCVRPHWWSSKTWIVEEGAA